MLEAKRVKLSSRLQTRGCGHVLTLGQGDTGQLGLGEDIMERARPALVKVSREMETVISIAANELSAKADHVEGPSRVESAYLLAFFTLC